MATPLDRRGTRAQWQIAKRAESSYQRRLTQIAKTVKTIIDGFDRTDVAHHALVLALRSYADLISPWARAVSAKMLADVDRRNYTLFKQNAYEMGAAIKEELAKAPTGETLRRLMSENVTLIRSIPLKAAERVHELSMERLSNSIRSKEMVAEIMEIGGVTERRAKLIARTEVSRANASLLEARAEYAGSEGYIWRTVGDHDVRESHKRMDGKYVRWDSPPTTDGMVGHAGCTPNCRCTAEPVLPGESIEQVQAMRGPRHAKGMKNEIKPKKRRRIAA